MTKKPPKTLICNKGHIVLRLTCSKSRLGTFKNFLYKDLHKSGQDSSGRRQIGLPLHDPFMIDTSHELKISWEIIEPSLSDSVCGRGLKIRGRPSSSELEWGTQGYKQNTSRVRGSGYGNRVTDRQRGWAIKTICSGQTKRHTFFFFY